MSASAEEPSSSSTGSASPEVAPPRSNSVSATFNYLHLDADKLLTAFGKFGRYQMVAYVLTSSVQMLFALNMMIMPFITQSAKATCQIPDSAGSLFLPAINDSCRVFNTRLNTTASCRSVDGYSYTYAEPKDGSLTTYFDLVCEHDGWADHATSIFLIGGMVASPVASQLSDTLGRRPIILTPLVLAIFSNLLGAFAWNFNVFLVSRFLSGFATNSFVVSAYTLGTESVSNDFRSFMPIVTSVAWMIGYMLCGVFDLVLTSWRSLYLAVTVPFVCCLVAFMLFAKESPHWLLTNKKDKRVRKYVTNAMAFNKQSICLMDCRSDDPDDSEGRHTFLALFRPRIFFHVILNGLVLVVMSGTYWVLSLYSTELSEDRTTGYFLSGFIELPAGVLAAALLVQYGRKTVSWLALVLTSVFMLGTVYIPLPGSLNIIFPLLAKATNSIVWSSQPIIISEAIPTPIRNVFSGVTSLMGELGSIGAPYTHRLTAINKDAPAILISILSLFAAALVTLQQETKGKKMPDDFRHFDAGPFFAWLDKRRELKKDKKTKKTGGGDVEAAKTLSEGVELLEVKRDGTTSASDN